MKHTPLVNVCLPTGIRRIHDMRIIYEREGSSSPQHEIYVMQLMQTIDNRTSANLMLCQVQPEEKKKKQFVSLRLHGVKGVNENG